MSGKETAPDRPTVEEHTERVETETKDETSGKRGRPRKNLTREELTGKLAEVKAKREAEERRLKARIVAADHPELEDAVDEYETANKAVALKEGHASSEASKKLMLGRLEDKIPEIEDKIKRLTEELKEATELVDNPDAYDEKMAAQITAARVRLDESKKAVIAKASELGVEDDVVPIFES